METFFLVNRVDVVLPGGKSTASKVQIRWSGANTSSSVAGEELLRGYSNYFRGNEPSRWLRNVPQYGQLKYENIYRGIDLVFHSKHFAQFHQQAGFGDGGAVGLFSNELDRLRPDSDRHARYA
jgi:hypothetical protein